VVHMRMDEIVQSGRNRPIVMPVLQHSKKASLLSQRSISSVQSPSV
jgi:hypothetical protein